MTSQSRTILALAAAAALLGGCATGPYYDSYGNYVYNDAPPPYYYERPAPRYYEAPPYYAPYYSPYYYGPSVGFGFSFSNRGHGHR
jgi:hypothetical protein